MSNKNTTLGLYFGTDPIIETEFQEIDPGLVNQTMLSSAIDIFGPFPPYSSILGLCEDGLPLLIDLANPKSGAILIENDSHNNNIEILNSMLTSLCWINPPEKVGFCIISRDPDKYIGLYDFPHCQALVTPFERRAGEIIISLSTLTEQRRYGRQRGAAMLLIIDEFDSCVDNHFDINLLLHLKWIIAKGPQSMIWPIAAVCASNYQSFFQNIQLNFNTIIRGIKYSKDHYYRQDTYTPITLDKYTQSDYELIVGNKSRRFSSLLI